jgi:8-oxo-dGTP pyrophosphatase MutT (NUDIX family)
MQTDPNRHLSALLAGYETDAPDQITEKSRFAAFAASSPDVYLRTHATGHFTASCWLLSGDGQRVLLTHHKKLARWLQLGGHADGDTDLVAVALREAIEESGLQDLAIEPAIFDLDAHQIPARPDTPAHIHWDVRFVLFARGSEAFAVSDESHALAWRDVRQIAHDESADHSLRRMAQKWLARAAMP